MRFLSYILYYPKKDFSVPYMLEMPNKTSKQKTKIRGAEAYIHQYLKKYVVDTGSIRKEWFNLDKDQKQIMIRAFYAAKRKFGGIIRVNEKSL